MQIIRANPGEAGVLTEIAFAAKRSWGYPDRWMECWREELTIRPEFIASHETHLLIQNSGIAGFYALAPERRRVLRAHLWIRPDLMRRGPFRCKICGVIHGGGMPDHLLAGEGGNKRHR
jgi:hypothetical protein